MSDADLSDPARLALELPQSLLTGFWEETLVRGFLLHVLLVAALRAGRGPMAAVVASSVVFGLLHAINLVDAPPAAVASQVLYATLFGVGFAALLLRTNALPALIVAHALIDLGPALRAAETAGDEFQLGAVIAFLPLAVYGVFLLQADGPAEGVTRADRG